jgi:hypothetical protein
MLQQNVAPAVGVDQAHLVSDSSDDALVRVAKDGHVVAAVEILRAAFVIDKLFVAAQDQERFNAGVGHNLGGGEKRPSVGKNLRFWKGHSLDKTWGRVAGAG